MIGEMLEKLKRRDELSQDEVFYVFDRMLTGGLGDEEVGEFLKLLAFRGETPSEVAACVKAVLKHAVTVDTGMELLDTCGTGGDGKFTFNISTASAIVCSVHVPVAKHGNRSVSSRSGSADVLEKLGIPVDMDADQAIDSLKRNNFVFLFAQRFHPAMRYVAPIRKKLGVRTVFNLVGPLANPFMPKHQLIGVFDRAFLPVLCEAALMLGRRDICFVSSFDGMDEVSLSDLTEVCWLKNGSVKVFEFDPMEFGISADISSLRGFDADGNARLMYEMFMNRHEKLKDAVSINAAFALVVSGVEDSLRDAFVVARETIENGKALDKLMDLRVENVA